MKFEQSPGGLYGREPNTEHKINNEKDKHKLNTIQQSYLTAENNQIFLSNRQIKRAQ